MLPKCDTRYSHATKALRGAFVSESMALNGFRPSNGLAFSCKPAAKPLHRFYTDVAAAGLTAATPCSTAPDVSAATYLGSEHIDRGAAAVRHPVCHADSIAGEVMRTIRTLSEQPALNASLEPRFIRRRQSGRGHPTFNLDLVFVKIPPRPCECHSSHVARTAFQDPKAATLGHANEGRRRRVRTKVGVLRQRSPGLASVPDAQGSFTTPVPSCTQYRRGPGDDRLAIDPCPDTQRFEEGLGLDDLHERLLSFRLKQSRELAISNRLILRTSHNLNVICQMDTLSCRLAIHRRPSSAARADIK